MPRYHRKVIEKFILAVSARHDALAESAHKSDDSHNFSEEYEESN